MVFSSITFLFYFLPITILLVWLVSLFNGKNNFKPQNMVLLLVSLLFYSWGEPVYVFLMIASILLNFLFGKAIDNQSDNNKRKAIFLLAIALNVASLAVFKYSAMLVGFINALIPYQANLIAPPEIRLPIGISFFTFQALSYLFDVYKRQVPAQTRLLNLALYISFFPQLIAGPIVRYHDINKQLDQRTINKDGVYQGIKRFTKGLAKKVLLANVLAIPAEEILAMAPNELTAPLAWFGVVCYALQIYFDFSGYSDMAIGLGRIFGFKFLENFNYPYISKGIQEFWQRWHISLSTWFRDYLYIPLGGNRKGKIRTYINLITVFFLCGLWHGASWSYVVWGLFHGLFLVIEKMFLSKTLKKWPAFVSHFYTIFVLMLSWVLFRASNYSDAMIYYKAMFGFGANSNLIIWKYIGNQYLVLTFIVAIIASTPLIGTITNKFQGRKLPTLRIPKPIVQTAYQFLILVLIIVATGLVTYPYQKIANNSTSRISITSNSGKHQIFYTSENQSFSPKNSIILHNNPGQIPSISKLNNIRIDAELTNGDVWTIDTILLQMGHKTVLLTGKKLSNLMGNVTNHLTRTNGHNLSFIVTGNDPYFLLNMKPIHAQFEQLNESEKSNMLVFKKQWMIAISITALLLFALFLIINRKQAQKHKNKNIEIPLLAYTLQLTYVTVFVLVLVYTISSLASNTYNPFIYFRF